MTLTKWTLTIFPFAPLYHDIFGKIKFKVSRECSGNQLAELFWAWGNPGEDRQQKEATSIYLQGLLTSQAQEAREGSSRKLSQSVTSRMVPCFAAYVGWPAPKRSCTFLRPHPLQHPPVLWGNIVLPSQPAGWAPTCSLHGAPLISRDRVGRNCNLKMRTQKQICRNRLDSSDLFMCVYEKINKEAY